MAMWPTVQINTFVQSLHNLHPPLPSKRETLITIIVLIFRFECYKHKGGCGIRMMGVPK